MLFLLANNFKNFFYGYSLSNNVELYKALVKELAQVLERQFVVNPESRAAGMVINTMGWIDGVGYEVKFSSVLAYFLVKLAPF